MALISTRNYLDNAPSLQRQFSLQDNLSDESTSGRGPCAVTFVNSANEIPDDLWAATFPPNAEGRWFYEALERSGLHGQFTFFYAKISQAGVPVAVAPIFLTDVPVERVTPDKLIKPLKAIARIVPSILYQRTLFVGCPCSAEGAVGVLPDVNRPQVLLALQKALEKKARQLNAELMVWKDMPPGIARDLDWIMKRRRLFRAESLPGTLVNFSSQRKSDYFAQLKASRRHALKKKLKLSAMEVAVSIEVLQNPEPDVLDEIFLLFRQTYLKSKMKFEELNRKWFEKLAEAPQVYFIVLREKQTPSIIAFMACFDCGSCLINKHVGFDYSRPRSWMLYFRLWDAAVDWALSKGFTSIHSGQTAYVAKIEMGHELIPLVNYVRHRNFLLHAIYRKVAQKLDWASLDEGLASFVKAHPSAALASAPVPPARARFPLLARIPRNLGLTRPNSERSK